MSFNFLDGLQEAVVNGINKKVDAEFSEPAPIVDDRTFSRTSGGGVAVDGYNNAVSAMPGGKTALMIGGGLIGLVVLLKVLKVV